MVSQDIEAAAQLIKSAKHMVALTGAGISTASGIPDFRSRNSGLWQTHNPVEIASIFGFKRRPEAFYNWLRPLARVMLEATPNPAHVALAQLEKAGFVQSLITQNIDMLHTKAGSQSICEVHGHMRRATCIECYSEFEAEPLMQHFLDTGEIPHCPKCNGILKPNVILFGEQLPVRELFAAKQAARHCDVMLVAGSSLEVAPAGDLPLIAKQYDAKLILVNFETTHVDSQADVLIHDNVVDILPQIAMTVLESM